MLISSIWPQRGLKTGMYYLRTRAAADAIKFTVDQLALAKTKAARVAAKAAIPAVAPLKVVLPLLRCFLQEHLDWGSVPWCL